MNFNTKTAYQQPSRANTLSYSLGGTGIGTTINLIR